MVCYSKSNFPVFSYIRLETFHDAMVKTGIVDKVVEKYKDDDLHVRRAAVEAMARLAKYGTCRTSILLSFAFLFQTAQPNSTITRRDMLFVRWLIFSEMTMRQSDTSASSVSRNRQHTVGNPSNSLCARNWLLCLHRQLPIRFHGGSSWVHAGVAPGWVAKETRRIAPGHFDFIEVSYVHPSAPTPWVKFSLINSGFPQALVQNVLRDNHGRYPTRPQLDWLLPSAPCCNGDDQIW